MSTSRQLPTSFTLNNGTSVPAVGLGTFQGDEGNSKVKEVVLTALLNGYRHIDGATAYGNEKDIGEAINESSIPRNEIYVTTKLAQSWHEPKDVEEALNQSLKALGLEYVDLYLMHFPHAYLPGPGNGTIRHPSGNGEGEQPTPLHYSLLTRMQPVIDYERSRKYPETWQAMERVVDSGKAKSIGLSNFNILKTKRVLQVARIKPAVNQVEMHPYLPQHDLLKFYKEQNLHLMAHQPLGGKPVGVVAAHPDKPGPLFDSKIILSWAIQRGTSVVPKTVQTHRLAENLCLSALKDEHFQIVDTLTDHMESGPLRYLNPEKHLGFDIFSEEADEPVGNVAPWD
ncbi:Alcohol dehydrogenase [NADP(+)] A [Lachnellula arida]|uniref:Alcohol dehydrogenase [NADP(+)] A n=1 Tax=Lachnellula arida TaxID=1316785 RepID=A0A8T9B570_9HELO|nr:Alcohol dehydrogenase [NADP(+)] A [Lachnellula arida]